MRLVPAGALAILALAATNVSAQLVYEPFDYGSGAIGQPFSNNTSGTFQGYTNPSSGQPWFEGGGTASSTENTIASGSMTTPAGLASGVGNSAVSTVQDSPSSLTAINSINFINAGTTVYSSVLFTINDLSNVATTNKTGGFVFGMTPNVGHFTGTNLGILGSSLQVRPDQDHGDPTKFEVGLRAGSTTTWDTTDVFSVGTPVFLVFSYQLTGVAANDVQTMWVNPDPSTFGKGTAPAYTLQFVGNGVGANGIGSIFFNRGGNNSGVPKSMQADEIRADTSWAQVTPPTGSSFTGGSSTDWSNPGTWNAGGVPNAAEAFAYFTGSAGGTVNVDSPQVVGTLTFRGPGGYSISSSNSSSITFNGGTGGASAINVQATMDPVGPNVTVATSHAISVPLTLSNNLEVNVATSQTLTVSGNITDSTGTATLTKNGPGTLILSGTNNYGGLTTVNSGVLAITGDAALGAVPAAPTANLLLVKGSTTSGTLRFDADVSLNANRTINIFQAGGGGPTINTNGHNATIAGRITAALVGGSGLVKSGAGTLFLRGDNSTNAGGGFMNSLTVNAGAVNVSQDVNLGKSASGISLNGGTLQFGASFNPAGRPVTVGSGSGVIDTNGFDATIDGVVSNSGVNITGSLTKTGAGTLTLTGSNTLNGPTRLTGGTLVLKSSAWAPVLNSTPGGAVVNSGALVFDYTGSSAPAVPSLLKSSHDSSNFTDASQRIRTSNTNDPNHGLGYFDDGTSLLTVKYTWYGDVNLDGTVDADDYALMDSAVAQGLSPSWFHGDFNYDGVVNSADYLAMDTSFGKIQGVLSPDLLAERQAEFGDAYVTALITAVPEPTSLAACGLALLLPLTRRRRSHPVA